MKTLVFLGILSASIAQAETNRLTLNAKALNELAEEARTNHPGMRAAEARLRAASRNESAISLWDDPEAMFGTALGSTAMRREQGDLVYGLEQKLPLTGKPQAGRKIARAELALEEAALEFRFQTLRREIVQTALRAAQADEVLRIAREDQAWVDTMVIATGERYKAGRATQVETLRMETEHATRAEQLRVAARDRESELIALNRLLNRALDAPWPELALPPLARPLASSGQLLQLAVRSEPKLKMLQREIERAEAGAVAARRARRPDFSLSVEGRQFASDGEFKEGAVLLKMSLPWFNRKKYDAEFAREQEKAEAARWEAADYAAQVRGEISRTVIRIGNARRQALLYHDQIVPRSEQTLAVAQSAWLNGRALFHEVLEARRMLLDGRLNYVRAVVEQYLGLSELVLCCGLADLEAVELYQIAQEEK